MSMSKEEAARGYWRENLKLMLTLLVVWFVVSFGAGVLFVDQLNAIQFFGFPLGFWFAQQGSIYAFVVLNVRSTKVLLFTCVSRCYRY